ncbi:probable rRNA maturation factor YbeY [Longilinea arvoryzae]|uniref:Endoribonuclease YbeY n=1 Tax=Longilinea arvoryzae TaxID=360412 RepID=A0A0S7BGJ3_9CHLR|nr:rRNA maturation RNase YbeY [Longilinea arvoryzae]GAP14717.1 probable rRNA maturation factor YbeY [Longilinea arvoryzae]
MNILINDEFAGAIKEDTINKTVLAVLKHEEVSEESDVSIVIDDDTRLQELNSQFLGIDAPTDVLSFPSDEVDPDSGVPYLGDIIISKPRAQAQAEEAGHALEAEVQLLIVHGMLHLLGYDHADEEQKREMWDRQKEILTTLDVHLSRLPD